MKKSIAQQFIDRKAQALTPVTKYDVYAGRSSRFIGNLTRDEIEQQFEEWPMKFNEENKTVYILEMM